MPTVDPLGYPASKVRIAIWSHDDHRCVHCLINSGYLLFVLMANPGSSLTVQRHWTRGKQREIS